MNIKKWTLIDADTSTYAENFQVGGSDGRGTPSNWSMRLRRLRGGLSEGVDAIEVHTGRLAFTVLPTRGLGLWRATLDGHVIGWQSLAPQETWESTLTLDAYTDRDQVLAGAAAVMNLQGRRELELCRHPFADWSPHT